MKSIIRAAALVLGVLGATAVSYAAQVNFDIRFSGRVGCISPVELDDVPLSIRAKAFLNTNGTAGFDSVLTAYYILSSKAELRVQLGGKPVAIEGGFAELRVLNENGLIYTADYSGTRYTVQIAVSGKRCNATLIPELKGNNQNHQIYAVDAEFLCPVFQVQRATCVVS